ncbi:Maf family protein [Sedimenticola selenatireducens]|uniref:7-methyl-GTP pyrophosphatase n=1 Tax=Sedimenticola selenatireducens TaxID=191960 RepID=A0A2N6CZU8_9GAMM|nr:nucleoside triphosphate pyrophosphatase [Sedimenticola selenatireducens]PLX62942.1 MAG: septum formation inhibitor Maf [Sedimenticola selenatireducens]
MNGNISTHKSTNPGIILGSTSPFRCALLEKLGIDFDVDAPEVDEQRLAQETPEQLVIRLAKAKAAAVAKRHPDSLVIGSDQVACIDHQILGKPGNRDNAIRQLSLASGKRVTFYTGLCLYNAATGGVQASCEVFHVHFRKLDKQQIERYLDAETPYNCAGSFKSEGLGISLFSRMEGDDPNSLIGLPLIRLIAFLDVEGIKIP